MNKKIILFGAFALTAFVALTAFGGKTKAEQEAEIAQAVQTQLDEFRQSQKDLCMERVTAAAQVQADSVLAAEAAAKPGSVKKTVKKSGPKVDPLPQGTTPAQDPQKTRGGAVQQGDAEAQKTRGGAVETSPAGTVDPAAQKKRGGAVKQGGGGK